MVCVQEQGMPRFEPFFVPYFDSRIARVKCSRGHENVFMIQSLKFEVLMESGADAFTAGFTLEACASFSAARERMYEFAIRVLAKKNGVNSDVLNAAYAEMARQSERQLGAFFILYALQFGEAYRADASINQFRNSVIHKGLIPTPEQAQDFCAKVYSEIFRVTELLREGCEEVVRHVVMEDLMERHAQIGVEGQVATAQGTTFFNLSRRENKRSFEEAVHSYLEMKTLIESSFPYMQELQRVMEELNHPPKPPTLST